MKGFEYPTEPLIRRHETTPNREIAHRITLHQSAMAPDTALQINHLAVWPDVALYAGAGAILAFLLT